MKNLNQYLKELDKLFKLKPYSLNEKKKDILFKKYLNFLNSYHYRNNKNYRKIIQTFYNDKIQYKEFDKMPFISTPIFKEIDLKSIKESNILKEMNSSGTSGKSLSKIYLDKINSSNQVKTLKNIVQSEIGDKRLPMLIVDSDPREYKKKYSKINARLAAINGFSIFGKNHTYILKTNMEINFEKLLNFLKLNGNKPFLIFGFTSLIYEFFVKKLNNTLSNNALKNGIIIHGGGWKKLENMNISNKKFNEILRKKTGVDNIINYYGLVEQTGSIFMECKKCKNFITSNFSKIIIRTKELKPQKDNSIGLIQLFSLIPTSYAGHILLTEDEGKIVKRGKCKYCKQKKGTRFKVFGRTKMAELRGCSDTI